MVFYYYCSMRQIISNNDLEEYMYKTVHNNLFYRHEVRDLFKVMYYTGCRISDVLSYSNWVVLLDGRVQLQPLKGNNLRYFEVHELPDYFYNNIVNNVNQFNGLFYGACEYHLKQITDTKDFRQSNKKLTTHLYRHNYAKKLHDSSKTDEEIRIILGETNISSARNYIYSSISYLP